ncbi:hypothetical protein MPTK1_6g04660 [Marchantia polymorpha subsp. ruderalis]|uniref:Uncharacterized protein n=2 Tax=Marchantia polymorpha TaxID=3197 RepID=A0AAF6BNI2_MARPO|nr:hypothetical protein MARPO_0034s0052 [Marchantia polymorpha]BBN13566.1 hypothetical protein Mp_6g04660 [Marchantia polymorpha subsp. ruderalis]|eukprot:PTQ41465.1 hypothetical protein MARPO_0034s0052 [Marchantia polymorpha]
MDENDVRGTVLLRLAKRIGARKHIRSLRARLRVCSRPERLVFQSSAEKIPDWRRVTSSTFGTAEMRTLRPNEWKKTASSVWGPFGSTEIRKESESASPDTMPSCVGLR